MKNNKIIEGVERKRKGRKGVRLMVYKEIELILEGVVTNSKPSSAVR